MARQKNIQRQLEIPDIGLIIPIHVSIDETKIFKHCYSTPAGNITIKWIKNMADPNWKIPGLQHVSVIFDDLVHEVGAINNRPNLNNWKQFIDGTTIGMLESLKDWILVIYRLEEKNIAELYLHKDIN